MAATWRGLATVTEASAPRGEARVARLKMHIEAMRRETAAWFDAHADDQRYARFTAHFEILQVFLGRLMDAIAVRLADLEVNQPVDAGATYERCHAAEQSLGVVRRTFSWYAAKYDQRSEASADRAATLLAADEIVRSCWSEPFAMLGRKPPSGPLAYFEPRFDAFATPRESVPADLRAPGDELIGQIVGALPIPTIALPVSAPQEPWWLILAAHETGHHVHKDLLAGLEDATRDALGQAVSRLPDGNGLAPAWRRWALESFADAFSVLMVGAAATWAVDELQFAPVERLIRPPSTTDRYPPPIVRLALLGEVARVLGLADHPFSKQQALDWLHELPGPGNHAEVELHVRATEAAAAALVDLQVDAQHTLRQVCGWSAARFAPKGEVVAWAAQFVRPTPVITPRNQRWAARIAISSGVSAFQRALAGGERSTDLQERLRRHLLDVLPTCGPPGVLAGPGAAVDVSALADRFAALLPDRAQVER